MPRLLALILPAALLVGACSAASAPAGAHPRPATNGRAVQIQPQVEVDTTAAPREQPAAPEPAAPAASGPAPIGRNTAPLDNVPASPQPPPVNVAASSAPPAVNGSGSPAPAGDRCATGFASLGKAQPLCPPG